jgi:pyruvate kinase
VLLTAWTGLGAVTPLEAMLSNVARMAIEFSGDEDGDGVIDATEGCIAIVITQTGLASTLVAKYRPPCPVFVVSPNGRVRVSALGSVESCYILQPYSLTPRGLLEVQEVSLVVYV